MAIRPYGFAVLVQYLSASPFGANLHKKLGVADWADEFCQDVSRSRRGSVRANAPSMGC